MDSENIEKIIFYSWQSDLPSVGNHYLIRDALRGESEEYREMTQNSK